MICLINTLSGLECLNLYKKKREPFKELIVRFETEEDYKNFQELLGQSLTVKTKSIWHPFRSHWGLEKKVYKDAA